MTNGAPVAFAIICGGVGVWTDSVPVALALICGGVGVLVLLYCLFCRKKSVKEPVKTRYCYFGATTSFYILIFLLYCLFCRKKSVKQPVKTRYCYFGATTSFYILIFPFCL